MPRGQREQHRQKRRLPEQHRRQPLQQHARVRHDHEPRRHAGHGRSPHNSGPDAHPVQQLNQREHAGAGKRENQRVGAHGDGRRLRGREQVQQALRAAEIREQAEHARRQGHEAHGPAACEELVGQRERPLDARSPGGREREPTPHVGAFERAQHDERPRPGSAEEQITCREQVEHTDLDPLCNLQARQAGPSDRRSPSAADAPLRRARRLPRMALASRPTASYLSQCNKS